VGIERRSSGEPDEQHATEDVGPRP
jgi:hypothetical protein